MEETVLGRPSLFYVVWGCGWERHEGKKKTGYKIKNGKSDVGMITYTENRVTQNISIY